MVHCLLPCAAAPPTYYILSNCLALHAAPHLANSTVNGSPSSRWYCSGLRASGGNSSRRTAGATRRPPDTPTGTTTVGPPGRDTPTLTVSLPPAASAAACRFCGRGESSARRESRAAAEVLRQRRLTLERRLPTNHIRSLSSLYRTRIVKQNSQSARCQLRHVY